MSLSYKLCCCCGVESRKRYNNINLILLLQTSTFAVIHGCYQYVYIHCFHTLHEEELYAITPRVWRVHVFVVFAHLGDTAKSRGTPVLKNLSSIQDVTFPETRENTICCQYSVQKLLYLLFFFQTAKRRSFWNIKIHFFFENTTPLEKCLVEVIQLQVDKTFAILVHYSPAYRTEWIFKLPRSSYRHSKRNSYRSRRRVSATGFPRVPKRTNTTSSMPICYYHHKM